MRAVLLETLIKRGYTSLELKDLPEEQLITMLTDEDVEVDLENAEVEIDEVGHTVERAVETMCGTVKIESAITITSPAWNDYVLSHFVDEELFDGNPTVDGLRRVTEVLIGHIVGVATSIQQVPTPDNLFRATAVVEVAIEDKATGAIRAFSGAADAYEDNLQKNVAKYPVAMAETRAEGRALRKALRLRNVSAEEVSANESRDNKGEVLIEPLNPNQISMIDMLARNDKRGLNINVTKLLEKLVKDGVLVYNSVKELSKEDGQKIIKALSAYQSAFPSIPSDLIGYSADWRK